MPLVYPSQQLLADGQLPPRSASWSLRELPAAGGLLPASSPPSQAGAPSPRELRHQHNIKATERPPPLAKKKKTEPNWTWA